MQCAHEHRTKEWFCFDRFWCTANNTGSYHKLNKSQISYKYAWRHTNASYSLWWISWHTKPVPSSCTARKCHDVPWEGKFTTDSKVSEKPLDFSYIQWAALITKRIGLVRRVTLKHFWKSNFKGLNTVSITFDDWNWSFKNSFIWKLALSYSRELLKANFFWVRSTWNYDFVRAIFAVFYRLQEVNLDLKVICCTHKSSVYVTFPNVYLNLAALLP